MFPPFWWLEESGDLGGNVPVFSPALVADLSALLSLVTSLYESIFAVQVAAIWSVVVSVLTWLGPPL